MNPQSQADPQTPANLSTFPSAPAKQQATPTSQPQIVMMSAVLQYPNRRALVNAIPAQLIWYSDNSIALQRDGLDQPEFHCPVADIAKFTYTTASTWITLRNGQKFLITFDPNFQARNIGASAGYLGSQAVAGSAGGAIVGIATDVATIRDEKRNDSAWWVDSLRRFGVKAKRISYVQFYGLVIGGIVVAIIVVATVITIVQSISL